MSEQNKQDLENLRAVAERSKKYTDVVATNISDQVNEYINETDEHLDKLDDTTSTLTESINSLSKKEYADVTGLSESIVRVSESIKDNKLTIQAEGKTLDSFTANSSKDVIINIKASDLGLSSAMKFIGVTTTPLVDGDTTQTIKINDNDVTATSGNVVLYKDKEFLWNDAKDEPSWEELGDEQSHALKSIHVNGVNGLTGGGTLENDIEISHAEVERADSTSSESKSYGETISVIDKIITNEYGHITGVNIKNVTFPNVDATLNEDSTNPVQNKTLTQSIKTLQQDIASEAEARASKDEELEKKIDKAGKIDDVQVNGTSVVTDKVANIDLTNYVDLTSTQEIDGLKLFNSRPAILVENELPEGYTELKYITAKNSTGAYIDTGIQAVAPVSWEIKISLNTLNDQSIIGTRNGSTSRVWNIYYKNLLEMGVGADHSLKSLTNSKNYILTQYNNTNGYKCYLDGDLVLTGNDVANIKSNIYIGKNNAINNGKQYDTNANYYYCKMWQGDELVRNFIPCIENKTGLVGMYDLVNNQFYSSGDSTNPFAAGTANTTTEVATVSDIEELYMMAITPSASETISSISEQNGVISVSKQNIQITQSQVTNLEDTIKDLQDTLTEQEVSDLCDEVFNV
jgi:hypothetical protein